MSLYKEHTRDFDCSISSITPIQFGTFLSAGPLRTICAKMHSNAKQKGKRLKCFEQRKKAKNTGAARDQPLH